jgi:hypothetical protein
MLNWFRGKIQRRASRQMKEEIQYFVDMLEGADLGGRALTVALAADIKNKIIDTPEFFDARFNGSSSIILAQLYQILQKEGLLANAAGCAVCLHSERDMHDLTLVPLARRMWELLAEAFPYVRQAAEDYERLMNVSVNAVGYENIPREFRKTRL